MLHAAEVNDGTALEAEDKTGRESANPANPANPANDAAEGSDAAKISASGWKRVSQTLGLVSIFLVIGIGVAFEAGRKEGLSTGKKAGLSEGEKSGFARGLHDGESLGLEAGKSLGFDAGKSEGVQEGKKQGYARGFAAGSRSGRTSEMENSKEYFGPALVVHHLDFGSGQKIAQVVIFNNTPWDYRDAKIGLNIHGNEGGYWYRMPKFESGESLKLGCSNFKSLNGVVFPSGSVCVSSEFRGLLDGRPISKEGLVYE
jgi:hypothetical protein